jgi:hypothetical protein
MDVLVMAMRMLSAEYELKWAHRWEAHLDEPKWLSKAMVNTYDRLSEEDKAMVNPQYEDWLWYAANLDLEQTVRLKYTALVVLVDRWGSRIIDGGEVQTILVELDGATRDEALCQLNRECYEFVRWWN